ncbi:uncharacterized protein [Dysidea avara]|uniref:uncharacterized protein n=1 Tax=Dysidea avara TaxID=196820 RepID=UPI003317C5FE
MCYKYSTYFIKVFLHDRFAALHGLNILLQKFYSSKQYSIYISQCISREFQTTLITAVMEAQNPRLCKEMCSSYLFYGDTCWFSVPESAATPQILSALSYCIAYSKKDWIVHCKGLDSDQADYLLKYLNSSKPSTGNRYKMCSTITVFDVIGSQSRIDGVLKLVQTPQCPQWLILSNCKLVDDDFMAMLSDALMDNNYLKQISLNSCNFNSKNVLSVVRLLKKNRTLECIYLQGNMTTLTEKDVLLLLQTIHHYNDIIYALLIDKIFCTADKVQEQLKIINNVREQKGVTQLRLSLYVGGGGIFRKLCQRVITPSTTHCSAKSPSCIVTRDGQSPSPVTVNFGEHPINIVCPHCHKEMKTRTSTKIGLMTWVMILGLILSCFWPFWFLPLCFGVDKDVVHSCSKCNAHLGVYRMYRET